MEGVSTNKIVKKRVNYETDKFMDEAGLFFADDEGVKQLFKKFRYIIQNKVSNALH